MGAARPGRRGRERHPLPAAGRAAGLALPRPARTLARLRRLVRDRAAGRRHPAVAAEIPAAHAGLVRRRLQHARLRRRLAGRHGFAGQRAPPGAAPPGPAGSRPLRAGDDRPLAGGGVVPLHSDLRCVIGRRQREIALAAGFLAAAPHAAAHGHDGDRAGSLGPPGALGCTGAPGQAAGADCHAGDAGRQVPDREPGPRPAGGSRHRRRHRAVAGPRPGQGAAAPVGGAGDRHRQLPAQRHLAAAVERYAGRHGLAPLRLVAGGVDRGGGDVGGFRVPVFRRHHLERDTQRRFAGRDDGEHGAAGVRLRVDATLPADAHRRNHVGRAGPGHRLAGRRPRAVP